VKVVEGGREGREGRGGERREREGGRGVDGDIEGGSEGEIEGLRGEEQWKGGTEGVGEEEGERD